MHRSSAPGRAQPDGADARGGDRGVQRGNDGEAEPGGHEAEERGGGIRGEALRAEPPSASTARRWSERLAGSAPKVRKGSSASLRGIQPRPAAPPDGRREHQEAPEPPDLTHLDVRRHLGQVVHQEVQLAGPELRDVRGTELGERDVDVRVPPVELAKPAGEQLLDQQTRRRRCAARRRRCWPGAHRR